MGNYPKHANVNLQKILSTQHNKIATFYLHPHDLLQFVFIHA